MEQFIFVTSLKPLNTGTITGPAQSDLNCTTIQMNKLEKKKGLRQNFDLLV